MSIYALLIICIQSLLVKKCYRRFSDKNCINEMRILIDTTMIGGQID